MHAEPIVSVLVTLFNREAFIASCIESVISSSLENWELIIVDDKSSDRSYEIAKSFSDKDKRIKLFQNKTNLGDYQNRNEAASHATGRYLKYLDADDLIYPHGLEQMVYSMEQFPDAGLGLQSPETDPDYPFPFELGGDQVFKRHFLEGGILFSGPSGTIIRREAFEKAGGFQNERHVSDVELWLRLTIDSPVVLFQPALVWWRQHSMQEHQLGRNKPAVISRRFDLNIKYIRNNPFFSPPETRKAEFLYKRLLARKVLSAICLLKFKKAGILLRSRYFHIYDIALAFVLSGMYPMKPEK